MISIGARDRIDAALGDPQYGKEVGDKLNNAAVTATAPTFTATTGSLPTAAGSTVFANAATPTVAELLDAVVELRAALASVISQLTS